MTEDLSSGVEGEMRGNLHTVSSDDIRDIAPEEQDAIQGPVFLDIDNSSIPDDELPDHLAYVLRVLPEYLKLQRLLEATGESKRTILTDPSIIIRTLLTELGVQADLKRLGLEPATHDKAIYGRLSKDDKETVDHTLSVEGLLRAAIELLDTKSVQFDYYGFNGTLDEYFKKRKDTTILRACAMLTTSKENPADRLAMIYTSRILKTMLYINDTHPRS